MPVDCQMCSSLSLSPSLPHIHYLSRSLIFPVCLYVSVQKKDSFLTAGKWKRPISRWRGKKCELSQGFIHKKHILCQCLNLAEVCVEAVVCLLECDYILEYIFLSWFMVFWKLHGCKCDLIVHFHKQVSSNTTEHLCAKNLNLSQ